MKIALFAVFGHAKERPTAPHLFPPQRRIDFPKKRKKRKKKKKRKKRKKSKKKKKRKKRNKRKKSKKRK